MLFLQSVHDETNRFKFCFNLYTLTYYDLLDMLIQTNVYLIIMIGIWYTTDLSSGRLLPTRPDEPDQPAVGLPTRRHTVGRGLESKMALI